MEKDMSQTNITNNTTLYLRSLRFRPVLEENIAARQQSR